MLNKQFNTKIKPDHRVITRLNDIEGVRCEVFLPNIPGDSLRLRFQTDAKLDDIPIRFSIEGDVIGFNGSIEKKIISNNVYRITGSTSYWSNRIPDTIIIGEPTELTIIEYRKPAINDESSDRVWGYFMIEPKLNFPFIKSLEMSYTGEINVRQLGEHKFTISPGVDLTLDEFYSFSDSREGKFECTPKIVAKFYTDIRTLKEIINFKEIDDLLMLVSFTKRKRHMCTGYVVSDSDTTKTYYRCRMAVDGYEGNQDFLSELIDRANWNEFVSIAYKKMNELDDEKRGFLRRAINCAISSKNETIESSYITLYSGIESLIELFSREHPRISKIFENIKWKTFKKSFTKILEEVLTNFPNGTSEKSNLEKKNIMISKLGYLNSYPTGKAFKMMANTYKVDLQDLWPVYETGNKTNVLSWIRNELVHGRVIPFEKSSALVGAREHLKWTLERLILGFLGWPIKKSNVSKDFLSKNMACYCSLQQDRSIFS